METGTQTINLSDFRTHPIYDRYLANELGQIINIKLKKIMKTWLKRGYPNIVFKFNGKTQNCYVHRFVYECFHGIIPNGMQVDHIDNNKLNNRLSNLQLLTPSENIRKTFIDNPNLRFEYSERKTRRIKCINLETNEISIFKSSYQASKELNIDASLVRRIAAKDEYRKSAKSQTTAIFYTFEYI